MTGRLTPEQVAEALRTGMRIAPSDPGSWASVWHGVRAPGSRWTKPQLCKIEMELEKAKADDSRFSAAVVAKLREPEKLEAWPIEFSDGSTVDCVLLARSRNGQRVLIITPGGDKLWRDARC